jgi:hypothetical protein
MKALLDSIADYSGPGALLTLLAMWIYVGVKKHKFSLLEYMLYLPTLFKEYKELTTQQGGRGGSLYYLFFVLVILTFVSIFGSFVF